jgi:WD40 repeat protein
MIVVCTPGSFQKLEKDDWVHREIDWWLKSRKVAPILIDATGEGERWVPKVIKDRWPDAQRITVVQDDLLRLQGQELRLFEERVRSRILNGIVLSKQRVVFEDLERQKKMSRRLSIALVVAGVALLSTVAAAVLAMRARESAEENASKAEARRVEAVKARNEAVAAQKVALSRQLGAEALQNLQDQFDLSLLLSVEALRSRNTFEARRSLFTVLNSSPNIATFLQGHTDKIEKYHVYYRSTNSSLAFSPNGRLLVSVARGDSMILWDALTRKPIDKVQFPDREITSVAFRPDGKTMALGIFRPRVPSKQTAKTTIILWDIETRRQIGEPLTGHSGPVDSIQFSSDGKIFASGSRDGTAILWDVVNHKQIGDRLTGHTNHVVSVAFDPTGASLVTGSIDGNVILWDVATHEPVGPPISRHTKRKSMSSGDFVSSVIFSPDGKILASNSENNTVILWDANALKPIGEPLTGHTDWITSLDFNPQANVLASASDDGSIILWDLDKHEPLAQPLLGHGNKVKSINFSPDGTMLASVSPDGSVILWNFPPRQPLGQQIGKRTFKYAYEWAETISFSPDGSMLASGDNNGNIFLWDTKTGCRIGDSFGIRQRDVQSMAFSPDGQLLVSGSYDGTIILWDIAKRKPLFPALNADTGRVFGVAFSPDGNIVASGTDDGIILWDISQGKRKGKPLSGHDKWVASVAISPDGKTLASGSADSTILLWDLSTRKTLGPPLIGHRENVFCVAFSHDGRLLASGSADNTIILWDVISQNQRGNPLVGHGNNVHALAFSTDSKTLVSGALYNGTVMMWDALSGRSYGPPLNVHTGSVYGVAYSPDGKTFATAGDKNEIFLWDMNVDSWQERACRVANRNLTYQEWQQYLLDEPYRKTCPNLPIHPSFIEAGRDLARKGDIEGAVTIFRRAVQLEPTLDLDPEEETQRLAPPSNR